MDKTLGMYMLALISKIVNTLHSPAPTLTLLLMTCVLTDRLPTTYEYI